MDNSTFVNNLSGGMKQKLAIVETILQKADTLFLDEPTAMLDVQATADLWQRLIHLWTDQTVLIVEHKVEHIWHHVDRVILMNYDGEIIADNTLNTYSNIVNRYSLNLAYGILMLGIMHLFERFNSPIFQYTFKFQNGQIIRSKNTLFEVSELNIHPENGLQLLEKWSW